MKKLTTFCLALLAAIPVLAQQKPHYTQYILNQYIINPALTGIENYVDIKISHRHQWVGINGGPVTSYVTVQGPIGKKDYRTSATTAFELPGENPRGQQYWENYTAPGPHHGAGLQIINDVTGPLRNTSIFGTYAYHIGLSPRTSLSGGIGIGISRFSLDASRLDWGGTVNMDPAVFANDDLGRTHLDATAGLYLYSADYFAGISAQQIVPAPLNFSNNTVTKQKGKTVPHLFATVGRRFLLNEDLNLIPSLMAKWVDPLAPQLEANMKLQYRNSLWAGAGYRHQDGFSGMLGFMVSNTFNVSYAYDHTTSLLNNFSKGSHELMLGFIIGNKYPDGCPRNVW